MNTTSPQLGLVLAGGGSKGAYQVGVLKYLADLGLKPQIIAGTSIGALNGAVLASQASFEDGVHRLDELWEELGRENILRFSQDTVFNIQKNGFAIFDPQPIERKIRQAVNLDDLRGGIELWVTVFPALKIPGINYNLLMQSLNLLRSKIGSTKASWFCAKDFEHDGTLYNLLLASAAIPFAFPQREVNGQFYVDGALGDNIPVGAPAQQGCTYVIVIHLDNGETWNRYDFPEQNVIEIRPKEQINKFNRPIIGSLKSLLDFSSTSIAELKHRGYQDAKLYLKPILQTFMVIKEQRQAQKTVVELTRKLLDDPPLESNQPPSLPPPFPPFRLNGD